MQLRAIWPIRGDAVGRQDWPSGECRRGRPAFTVFAFRVPLRASPSSQSEPTDAAADHGQPEHATHGLRHHGQREQQARHGEDEARDRPGQRSQALDCRPADPPPPDDPEPLSTGAAIGVASGRSAWPDGAGPPSATVLATVTRRLRPVGVGDGVGAQVRRRRGNRSAVPRSMPARPVRSSDARGRPPSTRRDGPDGRSRSAPPRARRGSCRRARRRPTR